jgi:predicted RNA-binding Zn ribbon-like protein
MAQAAAAYQFDFSGGSLCLDFANTLGDRPRADEEHLEDWRALVSWAEQAHVIQAREAAVLRASAARDPKGAERAWSRARAFREGLYRIFSALATSRAPADADLALLNTELAAAMPHVRVHAGEGAFHWGWDAGKPSLDRLLWPVARSAGDLLVSTERPDVRECASGVCSWLFLDRSPTRRRRWCSMKTCGNRAKARRFYTRHREAETGR